MSKANLNGLIRQGRASDENCSEVREVTDKRII